MPPPLDAVVFDLDGTLVDSAPDLQAHLNEMLAEFERPGLALDEVRPMIGDGARALLRRGFEASGRMPEGADLEALFAELARVVRPGGRIALLEVAEPENPFLRWGHQLYFNRVMPRVGALLSDGSAYRYLRRSVAYLPPPAVVIEQLRTAGFAAVERRPLSAGIAQLLTGTRGGG